jgi:N-acyl-D-amino-acid deacylase
MVVTTSVRKGLDLLFQSSDVFLNSRARCTSCHHQDLPAIAASIAHSRGIDIDVLSLDRMNRRWLSGVGGLARDIYAKDFRTLDVITGFGYQLWGRSALSLPDDPVTKAVVWYLANRQMAEGNWTARPRAPRMPLQDGEHVTTALAVRALQSYPLAGREAEFVARIEQARIWLENTPAPTHTQRAFRLLGLAWANAEPKALQGGIDDLLETQQKDGGWSQLNNLESDAWATGIALLALNAAGTAATDETYRRGIEYLVNTQFDDGSWFVRSRSRPALQHFDSHFPFGRDQWISASGTAVACASLALALDPVDVPIFKLTSAGDHVENEKDKRESPDTSEKTLPNLGNVTQSFSEDIRPILMNSCVDCHDTESQLGDYTMTDRRSLLRGGASGVHAVIPGHGAESQMVRHVTDQVEDMEMPPLSKRETYPALTAEQIQTLVTWIDEGAQWPEGVTLGGE